MKFKKEERGLGIENQVEMGLRLGHATYLHSVGSEFSFWGLCGDWES
jgi:hypothetical protein